MTRACLIRRFDEPGRILGDERLEGVAPRGPGKSPQPPHSITRTRCRKSPSLPSPRGQIISTVAVLRISKVILFGIFAAGILGAGCLSPSSCSPQEITPGIYQGSQPRTPADFAALRRQGIRTILSVEVLTCHVVPEARLARQNGFVFRNIPILPSPVPPRQQSVQRVLLTLRDASLYPIFLHCYTGTDRTTFITGLYRVYYLGWTPEAAWRQMLREGFHPRWWLYGFKTYFWSHASIPAWARASP